MKRSRLDATTKDGWREPYVLNNGVPGVLIVSRQSDPSDPEGSSVMVAGRSVSLFDVLKWVSSVVAGPASAAFPVTRVLMTSFSVRHSLTIERCDETIQFLAPLNELSGSDELTMTSSRWLTGLGSWMFDESQ